MRLVASWIPRDTHLQSGYLNDGRSGEMGEWGRDVCDCLHVCSESVAPAVLCVGICYDPVWTPWGGHFESVADYEIGPY